MRLEGEIEFASGNMPRAITSLMRGATAVAAFDVPLARTTLLHAAAAARFAGTFAPPGGRAPDISLATRRLPLPSGQEATAPHLLDAYAALHLDGNALAMPVLRRALDRLAESDTPAAMLAGDDLAEDHYRDAIELLEHSRAELQLARAHLLYGEWLRRQKRLTEARHQLRAAYDFFMQRGVGGFAARARIELEAAGEHVSQAPSTAVADLTAQEAQIVRLAADGLTNQEIAAKLFLSASMVDYHLRKVFRKLSISSRRRLRGALA